MLKRVAPVWKLLCNSTCRYNLPINGKSISIRNHNHLTNFSFCSTKFSKSLSKIFVLYFYSRLILLYEKVLFSWYKFIFILKRLISNLWWECISTMFAIFFLNNFNRYMFTRRYYTYFFFSKEWRTFYTMLIGIIIIIIGEDVIVNHEK